MRHLQLYTALREVVIEGSIRKAAEKLTISPSSLNRKILALEEELGVPFFERLASGVRLSTAGEIYYRHFIEHLAEIERAHGTVADLSGVRIGHIRVATSRGFEHGLLMSLIKKFRAAHPGVRFSVLPKADDRLASAVLGLQADLALMAAPERAELEVVGHAVQPMQLLVAREAAQGRTELGLGDLSNFDLILPPPGHALRRHLEHRINQQRARLTPALETTAPMPPQGDERPSAQLCLAAMVDTGFLRSHDATLLPLARMPASEIALCKAPERGLSVAAGKFAMELSAGLSAA
ncbi:LysR family transcriptional regulator [Actibacterium atlanticum]|nr:LysR family transcriptional regulator [Actibacterium atlanticum]